MTAWLLIALVAGAPTFLKGQLHLHTNNSGDSATPPADAVRWYAAHGYDFIVVTDHNRITAAPSQPSMLVIPGVELTQNLDTCVPPPPSGSRCPLHVNALFVAPPADGRIPWPSPGGTGPARIEIYRRAIETARRLGGIAQLNHPNFHYAADAPLIAQLAREGGLTLMEIANRSWDSNDIPADKGAPSSEAIWDAALTAGADIFGTATDDAHHYFDSAAAGARGEAVFPGDLGFVMVRAARDPQAIRAAILRGDFYASTGVLLDRIERTGDRLQIDVAARSPGRHSFTFIGAGGRVLARAQGRTASFALAGARGGYVRAVIQDGVGRRAWTQPIRVAPHAPDAGGPPRAPSRR
jgi:hypothetical protein